jgi:Resolvase, N terminal domain
MIRRSAHWRQCAHKSRHLADQFSDPLIKKTILDIALSYERLAIHVEAEV